MCSDKSMVIVTPFQEKKKQRYKIFILIAAILGLFFVAWYKFFPKQPSALRALPQKPERININFDVLKNPILTKLFPFDPVPNFKPEDAGRNNPFQPY